MKKPDLETRKSPKVLSEAEQRTEKEISNIKKEMLNKGKGDTKKSGKKEFIHKGKKYKTLLKGEKPDKIMPELSGKTSKKIKKFVGA